MDTPAYSNLELLEMISALPEPGNGADAQRGKQFLTRLLLDHNQGALFDFIKQVEGAQRTHTALTLDDLDRHETYLLRQMRKPVINRRDMLLSTATIGGFGAFLMGDGAMRFVTNANKPVATETIQAQHLREVVDSAEVVSGGLVVASVLHAAQHSLPMEERLQSAVRAANALIAEQEKRAKHVMR